MSCLLVPTQRFQAVRAELSSRAVAFTNSRIPANSDMAAYHNSTHENMLKLRFLAVSLSTKDAF